MADQAKQEIDNVKSGGRIDQTSDVAKSEQSIKNSEAKEGVSQRLISQLTGLKLGRYQAVGTVGVIGLVVIVAIFLLVKYLSR
jgi:hypothetical protein